jgi:hypothetical protein
VPYKKPEKNISRVAYHVRLYLEYMRPQMERSASAPTSPMDRKARRGSNPPIPDYAHALLDANIEASRLLGPALEDIKHGNHSFRGIEYRDIIRRIEEDPGYPTSLRYTDPEEAARFEMALSEMCRHVARVLLADPNRREKATKMWVVTSVDTPLSANRAAS